MIAWYDVIEWGVGAFLALGASLIALKTFKLAPLWAVVIGIVIFTGLQFPIKTHAVLMHVPPPNRTIDVVAWVMPDGSVKIDGTAYSDPVKLKAKIIEIKKLNPFLAFHVRAQKNTPFKTVGAAILLLQKSGAPIQVGFITEPRPEVTKN